MPSPDGPCPRCPCPESCLRLDAYCGWAARTPPDPVEVRNICDGSRARDGAAPSAYPSPARLAANLSRSLWDWAVSGFSMASEDEQSRRISICESCESFDPGPRRCRQLGCGCYLDAKTRLKTEHCPVGKW